MAASHLLSLAVGIAIGAAGLTYVQAQQPESKSNRVMRADLTGEPGKEVIMTLIDLQPRAGFPAHRHYGDEFVFVIDGAYARFVGDQQSLANAQTAFHIERERVHGGKASGTAPTKLLTVHIVDKGKPFSERVGAN